MFFDFEFCVDYGLAPYHSTSYHPRY